MAENPWPWTVKMALAEAEIGREYLPLDTCRDSTRALVALADEVKRLRRKLRAAEKRTRRMVLCAIAYDAGESEGEYTYADFARLDAGGNIRDDGLLTDLPKGWDIMWWSDRRRKRS